MGASLTHPTQSESRRCWPCSRGGAELDIRPGNSSCSGRCCKSVCCCSCISNTSRVYSDVPITDSDANFLELQRLESVSEKEIQKMMNRGKFVIPGSQEQLEIARQIQEKIAASSISKKSNNFVYDSSIITQGEVIGSECVICLGEFSWEDPEVLTLCSCGMNKTAFHYSCLLHWMDGHNYCPACRGNLYFEENARVIPSPNAE